MKKRILALALTLALCASFPALAQNASSIPMKNFTYADWGLSIDAPEPWRYEETGTLPPKSNRPFKPTTDTLSSKDTFYLGTWTADSSEQSPWIRLRIYYTSAGTVERIAGVKDKMMNMYVQRTSTAAMPYQAGTFEILPCGEKEWACFSMTATALDKEYVLWNFVLPFKKTVVQMEGFGPVQGDVDIKQVLTEMAATASVK